MSWDVTIMKFGRTYGSVEDIPDDATPLPLGSTSGVHASVTRFFPGTDWSDATWGIFDSLYGSIEFNLGKDDPAISLMLHVRASNEVVAAIVAMCREYGWNALDCSTGESLENSTNPTAGIEGWRSYRDKVLGRDLPEREEPGG